MARKVNLNSYANARNAERISWDSSLGVRSINCIFSQKDPKAHFVAMTFNLDQYQSNSSSYLYFDSKGACPTKSPYQKEVFWYGLSCQFHINVAPLHIVCEGYSPWRTACYIYHTAVEYILDHGVSTIILDSIHIFKGRNLTRFMHLLHSLRREYKVRIIFVAESTSTNYREGFNFRLIKDYKKIARFVDSYIGIQRVPGQSGKLLLLQLAPRYTETFHLDWAYFLSITSSTDHDISKCWIDWDYRLNAYHHIRLPSFIPPHCFLKNKEEKEMLDKEEQAVRNAAIYRARMFPYKTHK